MKYKLQNLHGKGPATRTKSGKFEVSIWHWRKIVSPSDDVKAVFSEREIEVSRACIRFSQWNWDKGGWEAKTIWCSTDDLRSLVQALDSLNMKE